MIIIKTLFNISYVYNRESFMYILYYLLFNKEKCNKFLFLGYYRFLLQLVINLKKLKWLEVQLYFA